MDCPDFAKLLEKPGCKKLINDLMDELITIATAQDCKFPEDFKPKTIDDQLKAPASANIMHQDFLSRRPLEIETFLGSPIKAGKAAGIPTPHLDTLYPILHHLNQHNQNRPPSPSGQMNHSPRLQMPPGPRPGMNGPPPTMANGMGPRRPPPPGHRPGMDPNMARRPPPPRGMTPNGHPVRGPPNTLSRRNSFDDDLEEFGHIALYGDGVEDPTGMPGGDHSARQLNELALRERELAIREREYALRQNDAKGGFRKGGMRKKFMSRSRSVYGDDDDDGDDFYVDEPPPMPPVDVDNFDMMSMTSRRNRRLPSTGNIRNNPDAGFVSPQSSGRHSMFNRPGMGRQRASTRLMSDVPALHESITDNPLMGYASNRYGTVDRKVMTETSRANSLTSQRMDDIRNDPSFSNAYPAMPNGRRMSQSPDDKRPELYNVRPGSAADRRGFRGPSDGNPQMRYPPGPNGYPSAGGYHQPTEHPMSDGVSHPRTMKGPPSNNVRSTTGSASASTNDSASGDTSANSSLSSLEKRVAGVAVR